jgi:hypothetical protein
MEASGKLHVPADFSLGKLNQDSLKKKKKIKKGPDCRSHREVMPKLIIHSKQTENVSTLSF